MSKRHIVIIGAGPTGLGAAWRLEELGHHDWILLEASPSAGGLASSIVDAQGFTWDLGGHVLFSHYRYFDGLMEIALGNSWIEHEREAWVRIRERWIPYPFQNNIWRLPESEMLACLEGLVEAQLEGNHRGSPPVTFEDWLLRSFGHGLCQTFMYPYNFKVWAYPPRLLDTGWMGERVATLDIRRILRNTVLRRDDVGWGPNATFRFPLHGGTGAIWRSLAGQLPHGRILTECRVDGVDSSNRTVRLADGRTVGYDALISTMPLDRLIGILDDPGDLRRLQGDFVHSSSHIIGIGLEGPIPEDLKTKCWMYFPEDVAPFYRATVFSNYSPHNVPHPGRQWSLMAEVSESTHKPVESHRVVEDTIAGFQRCEMIRENSVLVSTWHTRLEYGYPTPWLGRDDVLAATHGELDRRGIYSRGRFGAWKYEVSNQDHSVMQGVEAVGNLLNGEEEHTFHGNMLDWLDPPSLAKVRDG